MGGNMPPFLPLFFLKEINMLEIQKFLHNGGNPDRLRTTYGITHKRHGEHPNLVLFKYDQRHSPMGERIVQEARGIILDEDNNWEIVSRAFDKFFNYGEGHAAKIDWNSAVVQEKLDGSLITMYWYKNKWHVATTGMPDASGPVVNLTGTWSPRSGIELPTPRSFAEYFWQTFELDYGRLEKEDPQGISDLCFFFELTGPLNQIVIRHEEAQVTLLGARSTLTDAEFCPGHVWTLFDTAIPCVRSFSLRSLKDTLETIKTMNPFEQEGYVVVDANFNRIKIKHPGYVAAHHAKDGLSTRAIVEIVRSGEIPEFVSVYPAVAVMMNSVKANFEQLVKEIEDDYARVKGIQEQKAFALEAIKTKCSGALFALRARKVDSVRDFLANMQIDSVVSLLGL
jgi:hypothetical protein